MRESDDEFDKSAKNDFINQERGVDNSICKEGTTNNKFDEVSVTNDKIAEKRASPTNKIVDEDAVEKDESVRSAMSRKLQNKNPLIQKGQSGECTETASVPDSESECKNLSFIV